MDNLKNGGRAFPCDSIVERDDNGHMHGKEISSGGMTLRDYFAAKAMAGWLASYPESCTHPIVAGNADEVAKHSYMLADAMLKARE